MLANYSGLEFYILHFQDTCLSTLLNPYTLKEMVCDVVCEKIILECGSSISVISFIIITSLCWILVAMVSAACG